MSEPEIDRRLLEILVCPVDEGAARVVARSPRVDQSAGRAGISRPRRCSHHAAGRSARSGRIAVPIATEIRVRRAAKRLDVSFDDGQSFGLPAEYLRVESPSAEVQGHAPNQKILVAGKEDVNIAQVEPIGNYAVRIRFSDGHDTGHLHMDLFA